VIFPTVEFAAFFVVVLTVSWRLMPWPHWWKPFILAASYFFYGYADVRFVPLLVASTLLNQGCAVAIRRWRRRPILVAAVAGNLGILGWFKYYGFFALSVDRALDSVHLGAPLPLIQVALPVGISFFTFQAMSYVIDVWRGRFPPARLLDFAVYEAFFPHLVAGPIVRPGEFIPQLAEPRDAFAVQTTRAAFLIAGGIVKKVVLADYLATRIVDPVFDSPAHHSSLEILTALYGYAVQIYCDFSAYSEMAIGLALLLGFRFPDNFDRPYAARSPQEFWRRWHMTLSRWLRDYLYIPLGGNQRGRRRTAINLLVTMVLGGLWHGAAWTFVIWGGVHGGALAGQRALAAGRPQRPDGPDRQDGARLASGSNRTTGGPGGVPAGRNAVPAGRNAVPADRLAKVPASDPGSIPHQFSPAPTVRFVATAGPAARLDPLAPAIEPEPGSAPKQEQAPGRHRMPGRPLAVAVAPARMRWTRRAHGGAGAAAATPARGAWAALGPAGSRRREWLARLATFHFVCLTWALFRAPDLRTFGQVVTGLATGAGPSPLVTRGVLVAIAAGLATQAVPPSARARARDTFSRLAPALQALALAAFLLGAYALVDNQGVAPFIYFRF